jgi:hypothetical protein
VNNGFQRDLNLSHGTFEVDLIWKNGL